MRAVLVRDLGVVMLRPQVRAGGAPLKLDSAGSQGRIVPREAPRIGGVEGRPDERDSPDRMSSDPTAPH
jgi:hypothetical protein